MWNLWWRDSNWGRDLYENYGFPFVVSLYQHSQIIFVISGFRRAVYEIFAVLGFTQRRTAVF
jgi:hypothetical protein